MPKGPRQRQAFDCYLRLGPRRTIPRLHAAMTEAGLDPPTVRTLYAWSSRYGWQRPLQDLEREAGEAERAALVAAYREMVERQAKVGQALQETGLQRLKDIKEAQKAEKLSAAAAIRAVVDGAKLERSAFGALLGRIDEE